MEGIVNMLRSKVKIYLGVIALLIAMGLPSRMVPNIFPSWYVLYAGDFLWAAVVFYSFCLLFNIKTKQAVLVSLLTVYLIEISQLFHPPWLQEVRQIKFFALIIGHGFLWSDIIAYTFGIATAALLDFYVLQRYRSTTEE